MPLYDFKCAACAGIFELALPLAEYDAPQTCSCGGSAVRQLSHPRVRGDYAGYVCPVTGKWIEGRKAHKENLARTGCRVLETGERQEAERHRRAEDRALDRAVEQTAGRLVAELPPERQAQLALELESNPGITVIRR